MVHLLPALMVENFAQVPFCGDDVADKVIVGTDIEINSDANYRSNPERVGQFLKKASEH